MHEGKHGILDDVEEMDDLFGTDETAEECKDGNKTDHDHKGNRE